MIPKSRAQRILDKSIVGSDVLLGIRPEDVRYEQALIDAHPESVIESTVDVIENLGNETILYLNVEGKDDYTIARVNARYSFEQGETLKMYLATEHAHLFDATTELTLMGVPDYNLIPAQAVAVENTLAIMFGDVCVKLPDGLLNRITDKSIINNKVVLGIPPAALKAEGAEGDVCIDGVAEFFDNYPRFKAVYLSVPGLVNNVIAARPLDYEFIGGESLKVYLDPSQVQLFNMDGERIIADNTVSGNTTTGTIINNNGVYNYKFAGANGTKNKLAFEVKPNEGEQVASTPEIATAENDTPMYILPRGLAIDKESLAHAPKMVLQGVIKHLYEYHKDAIVTAEVAGFDEDMTV
ncbi:MAG: TOBE domain-containing protein, partial [Clostridiales bacterium]|nr:TOBE domain-containing protein [Clostridiales bacterium]